MNRNQNNINIYDIIYVIIGWELVNKGNDANNWENNEYQM